MKRIFYILLLAAFVSTAWLVPALQPAYAEPKCTIVVNPTEVIAEQNFTVSVKGLDPSFPNVQLTMTRTDQPAETLSPNPQRSGSDWEGTYRTTQIGQRRIIAKSGSIYLCDTIVTVKSATSNPGGPTSGKPGSITINTSDNVKNNGINKGDSITVWGTYYYNPGFVGTKQMVIIVDLTNGRKTLASTTTDDNASYEVTAGPFTNLGNTSIAAVISGISTENVQSDPLVIKVTDTSSQYYLTLSVATPVIDGQLLEISGKVMHASTPLPRMNVTLSLNGQQAIVTTTADGSYIYKDKTTSDWGLNLGSQYTITASADFGLGSLFTRTFTFTVESSDRCTPPIVDQCKRQNKVCQNGSCVAPAECQPDGSNCSSSAGKECDPSTGNEGKGGVLTAIGCVPTEPKAFIGGVMGFAAGAGGGIALLLMIMGAFQMIASAGNPETIKKGREQFVAAFLGLLFIILSVTILRIIGVDILNIPGFK